jgi:hypothetical protein
LIIREYYRFHQIFQVLLIDGAADNGLSQGHST